jgi:hypothetical protein
MDVSYVCSIQVGRQRIGLTSTAQRMAGNESLSQLLDTLNLQVMGQSRE